MKTKPHRATTGDILGWTEKREKLIRKMVQSFEDLGFDPFARIDARRLHQRYRRAARAVGIVITKAKA